MFNSLPHQHRGRSNQGNVAWIRENPRGCRPALCNAAAASCRAGFRNVLQTKPAMLALRPMQQLRRRKIPVLEATGRYGNSCLQCFGSHQHHGSARRAKFLFQPLSRCPGAPPRSGFAFSADDGRFGIDRAVGERGAGAALAFEAAAGVDAARLAGENQFDAAAGTCRGPRADVSLHGPAPPSHAGQRNDAGSLKCGRRASPATPRCGEENTMSWKLLRRSNPVVSTAPVFRDGPDSMISIRPGTGKNALRSKYPVW
ncbi:hypothetical protein OJJOAM_004466 [Cupriavidus sp. H18C1]